MSELKARFLTDQVAEHLRRGMAEGRWRGTLPGRDSLAKDLGCSHWTVEEALRRLAREGWLVSQGPGKRRRIVVREERDVKKRTLRVCILLYEKSGMKLDYLVELLHLLQKRGHEAAFAGKTLMDLGMKVSRVSRFVEATEADAWVVVAGSREVLEWFASRPAPAFALFGRLTQVALPSTSPKKADALHELVDRLVELGHRRIVMVAREERRKPIPGFLEQLFLTRLSGHGIATGAYNLPDWEGDPEGLSRLLNSLFGRTPPTALIVSEPSLFFAILQHLASMGFTAPGKVSLACMDTSTEFDWFLPEVTHINWNREPLLRHIVKWVESVARGKEDKRKSSTKAFLVTGGTIGPVPVMRS